MPFTKARNYKRFNVGEYMRHKRLGSLAVEKKNNKAREMSVKLRRLDEKVRDFINFYIPCNHVPDPLVQHA